MRVLLTAALCMAVAGETPETHGEIAWLTGAWCGEAEGTFSEEVWMAPRGGLMLGLHRDTRAGSPSEFEFLRIELEAGRVTYIAQPGGKPPTAFALRASGARSVTFANDAHDFPKRITYSRTDATLRARVDNGSDSGTRLEWTWRRCDRQLGF
jgi:hypothetical protein